MAPWTEQDYQNHMRKREQKPQDGAGIYTAPPEEKKTSKYRNVKTLADGILFDSGHEADRYLELKALESLGEIRDLELQPKFDIFACEMATGRGIRIAGFKADFRYFDIGQNRPRVEDVKSAATKSETAYRLRKKLAEACHGVEIEEVIRGV